MTGAPGVPTFGPEPPADAVDRPGGYALILDDAGRLAVIAVGEATALPGGGADPGEDLAACAARETREETGLVVEVGPLVTRATQVVHAPGEGWFVKRCSYYRAAIVGSDGDGEPDHALVWLPIDEARERLVGAHRWAAGQLDDG